MIKTIHEEDIDKSYRKRVEAMEVEGGSIYTTYVIELANSRYVASNSVFVPGVKKNTRVKKASAEKTSAE